MSRSTHGAKSDRYPVRPRDRPAVWLDRAAFRLLHDEQPARPVGGRRWPAGAHLCAGHGGRDRRLAIAWRAWLGPSPQVDLSAAVVLGAGDVFRRPVVRLWHGAVERLRLTRADAARQ